MHSGHSLQFGTVITPQSSATETAVELAQRSEAPGYDLVTLQDDPDQPTVLDTWTTLAWIAGRTERIHLAAHVLNLPLRPPTVLACVAQYLADGTSKVPIQKTYDLAQVANALQAFNTSHTQDKIAARIA